MILLSWILIVQLFLIFVSSDAYPVLVPTVLPETVESSSFTAHHADDPLPVQVQRVSEVKRSPFTENRLIFDTADSHGEFDDSTLEEFVLVATVEGDLYALDRRTGAIKWVLEGEQPAVQSVQMVDSQRNTSHHHQPQWIVQPVDGGQLFIFEDDMGLVVASYERELM
jgi:hypothetical protein